MKKHYVNLNSHQIIITLLVIIYMLSYVIGYPIGCIIEGVTGIECPSCGMATAWFWLINGDIAKAFYYHPLFIVPFIALCVFIFDKTIGKIKKVNRVYIVLALMLLVMYLVRITFDIDAFIPLDTEFNLFNK